MACILKKILIPIIPYRPRSYKNISRSFAAPLFRNCMAISVKSKWLAVKFIGHPSHLSQTCLARSHGRNIWVMVSVSFSQIGHLGLMFTPFLLRFSLVGSPFMQAHHAKILIFSGIFKCHNFLHGGGGCSWVSRWEFSSVIGFHQTKSNIIGTLNRELPFPIANWRA